MPTSPSSTSLTARLARAESGHAYDPRPRVDEPTMSATEPAPARERAAADGNRCTSSVISGQRCSRIAPKGQALCAGHAAMSGNGPPPIGRR